MSCDVKPVILAIDDDAIILNAIVSTLRTDYSIRPFTSGTQALKFLEKHPADLILLDGQMPGMTGFEVLGALQRDRGTRDIPVIFITGAADGESEVEALQLGAVDFIRKPVKPRPLLTRVRLQIELQNHRRHMERLVEEKTSSLNEAYTKLKLREDITLNLLARITDMRDADTGEHIERTTEIVRIIVSDLLGNPQPGYSLSSEQGDDIVKSAKLHDLGKIATPDHILLKPGPLTRDEFDTIKQHPVRGKELLTDFIRQMEDSFLNTACEITYAHHERWDGTGYPQGLKGEEIPLSARIVAIADVYDALSSTRPYKEAYSHEISRDTIVENRGTHFDPHLVDVFLRHEKQIAHMGDRTGK